LRVKNDIIIKTVAKVRIFSETTKKKQRFFSGCNGENPINFYDFLRIIKKMYTFAPANGDVAVFHRGIKGNQVKSLNSTRYCNPHCEKLDRCPAFSRQDNVKRAFRCSYGLLKRCHESH
jgi:hypothetical protein